MTVVRGWKSGSTGRLPLTIETEKYLAASTCTMDSAVRRLAEMMAAINMHVYLAGLNGSCNACN